MNTLAQIANWWRPRSCARFVNVALRGGSVLALISLMVTLGVGAGSGEPARPAGHHLLPHNAKTMCPFAAAELADWFQSGRVETNGVVRPPNSMILMSNHCDFIKWAARAFLWVTSTGEGGGMTFESPEFFTVAAPDEHGQRSLWRGSVEGAKARGDVNYAASTGGKPLVKPLEHAGQPGGGGVLMAQNGSLVYFANHVNDVFAYFMTGVKKGEILPPTPRPHRVPVNESDLQKIVAFAQSKGVQLAHPDTLTVVVKSAWIEATGLDPNKYVTINATVPDFDTTDPARWTRRQEPRKTTLALVGIHIAASLRSDPSMIWATYEHVANTPTGRFSYLGQNGETLSAASVGENPDGRWNFSAGDCRDATREARMHNRRGVIEARAGDTIGPINTCRINAWGAPDDGLSPLDNNTRIIDVNRNSIGKLPADDVRSNYVIVGATWNRGDGSRTLANTTLETFTQEKGCLDCHVGNLTGPTGGLNRMWERLKPLD
jgi:hypothetical protein